MSAEQVGWPELVSAVEGAVARLSAADRSRAVILTANYGSGLPRAAPRGPSSSCSEHTGFWHWGPPPADRTVVVLVGQWDPQHRTSLLGPC